MVRRAKLYPELQRSSGKLEKFVTLIETLRSQVEVLELADFYEEVMSASGYIAALEAKNTVENRTRIENAQELRSSIQSYVEGAEEPSLHGFLDRSGPVYGPGQRRKAARTA